MFGVFEFSISKAKFSMQAVSLEPNENVPGKGFIGLPRYITGKGFPFESCNLEMRPKMSRKSIIKFLTRLGWKEAKFFIISAKMQNDVPRITKTLLPFHHVRRNSFQNSL